MKVIFSALVLVATFAISPSFAQGQQQTIAFWDFEEVTGEDEDPQITLFPSIGTGTFYQQRADTDGNGKGGAAFMSAALGIDVADSRSIAWDDFAKSGDNDGEFFTVVSTVGYENIQVSFDYQGNDDNADGDEINVEDGFTRFDAKYSLTNLIDVIAPDVSATIPIKDFDGESVDLMTNVTVTNDSSNFQRMVLNAPAAVCNQQVFAFRLDDFEGNDSVRFDNVLITGTSIAIPEPSSLALIGFVGFVIVQRRRRS